MKTGAGKSATTTATKTHTSAQPFFAKSGGGSFFAPARSAVLPNVQHKLAVNKPGDKFEQEADRTADKVMRMPALKAAVQEEKLPRNGDATIRRAALPDERQRKKAAATIQKAPLPDDKLQKKDDDRIGRAPAKGEEIQRRSTVGVSAAGADIHASIQRKTTGGTPLADDVRGFMEPRFNADFSTVRVHHDAEAAGLSNQLSARAFTYKSHVFFSRGQYQPGTGSGKQLLAHELTHTIQQGHAIQRSPQISTTSTTPQVQRLGIQDALDKFAEWAYNIPGFRLLTIVLGFNPINMRSTDRNAANLLRALIEVIPGGRLITQALENHGVINKAAAWVEQKIAALGDIGGAIVGALKSFMKSLSWTDIFDLGGVWERAKSIFTGPIGRLIVFGVGVATELLSMVKTVILKPLAALAQGTRGYDLLKAILGADPITGEPVPRNAETLIGGFMKLIGQEDVWENIKKGNAVARAWAWFEGALSGLMGLVRSIPRKIIDTITSLTFLDIITVVVAFSKIAGAFVNIASDFISWGLNQVLSLLEIIFSVVAPRVMPYIKKAQATFIIILKNPIAFVGNLVRAGKQGFESFSRNFLNYLKEALIKWIVGPLADAGVYIPKSFSLIEIVKLVLSVLGLTWQNIRTKLVKIIPEPVLAGLENTAGILVTLVKDGPAAAWEQIKTELSEMKDQLIAQVTQMVSTEVVKAAVVKLVSMLNPAGAVIQAIIAIYNTITFFVQKIKEIAAVAASFIDSIADIAAGQVANAAKKVEQTMANTLTIVISFLAKFAGLGGIPDKVVGIIKKIRQPIDKGVEKIVVWLGNMLKKLAGAAKAVFSWAFAKKTFEDAGGKGHTLNVEGEETPRLIIRSDPKGAQEFLDFYLKENPEKNNHPQVPIVRGHIGKATEIAKQIAALTKKGADWKALQRSLLEENTHLTTALSLLVGRDPDVRKKKEKYKLEGLTGTYESIPKLPYDDLTADHQPQAAVLVALKTFGCFGPGGKLFERAAKRAHKGYAINLHKVRHAEGATYGFKGKETKESFLNRVKPVVSKLPPEEQPKAVVRFIKGELKRDVSAMKNVANKKWRSPIWKDVVDTVGSTEAEKTVDEIRIRIIAGEDQVLSQDLESLAEVTGVPVAVIGAPATTVKGASK